MQFRLRTRALHNILYSSGKRGLAWLWTFNAFFSYVSVLRRIGTPIIPVQVSPRTGIVVLLFRATTSDTPAHPMSVSSLAASRRRRVVCCRCWKTRFFEVINTLFGARPSSQVLAQRREPVRYRCCHCKWDAFPAWSARMKTS